MLYKETLHVRNLLYVGLPIVVAVVIFVVGVTMFGSSPAEIAKIDPTNFVLRIALLSSLWAASALGATLSCETDGHLEFAFTRPMSRFRIAVEKLLVDAVAIVLVYVAALGIAMAVYSIAMRGLPPLSTPSIISGSLESLAILLAWFGIAQALSASFRQGQLITGLMWPAAILLVIFAYVGLPEPLHGAVLAVNVVNPLAWAWSLIVGTQMHHAALNVPAIAAIGFTQAVTVLTFLAAAGCLAAALQWRRVES
jgi:hypothetical protein